MTKKQAVELLAYLLNRLALNPAEAAGAQAAVNELLKDLPKDSPPVE